MPDHPPVQLTVCLTFDLRDGEHADWITRQLLSQIREIDAEDDVLTASLAVQKGDAPEGTKGIDPVLVGAILVSLGHVALPKLLDFLHDWAMRRQDRTVRISYKSPQGESIEVEVPATMDKDEVKSWIDKIRSSVLIIK